MNISELLMMPINASSHGHEIDMMMLLIHVFMLILFVGWGAFFIVALLKFHKRANPKADYTGVKSHLSSKLEVLVVVIEAVLLIGFSIPFWATQINSMPERTDAVEVRIVAEQYAWNIHYPGPDGIFGATSNEFFNKQSNPLGIDPEDPNGKDDFTTINQLNLPIGKPVIMYLSSRDVIHSLFLPEMRVKQDVIPGMVIPTWFTPTKTGNWDIACAQLCGLGHYRMKGYLNILSSEAYKEWTDEQVAEAAGDGEEYDDFWN
ncbi:MAG: cytochrome c oxidase subunit 2 [Candidatus Omnitrophota bacterium]|jgi:cytochrome c oxidase subunit 2